MPVQKQLELERVYTSDGGPQPNVDLLSQYLYAQGMLTKELAMKVMVDAGDLLDREENLLQVNGKVTIIGDIHGQYYDLHDILKKYHFPD